MIGVYITCRDLPEAKVVAKHLLEKRLVACVNMFPVESMFHWKGNLVDEKEVAMLCKAQESFAAIEAAVKEVHSYEVPCVVAFNLTDSSADFSKWAEST